MKLLKIAEKDKTYGEFDEFFEESRHISIRKASPRVIGGKADIAIGEKPLIEYDAAFLNIPRNSAVFGRVLLEIIEQQGLSLNYSSTAFFTMAKKNYLYYVLNSMGVEIPETVVAATEKSVRNIDDKIDFPLIGRIFDEFSEVENRLLSEREEVEGFTEGLEYGENLAIFHENVEGEKYRCLATSDTVISLKDDSDSNWIGKENLKYSNPGNSVEKKVRKTMNSLGASTGEVLVKGGKVMDVNPNPDLDTYTSIAGKNTYETVSKELKR